MMYDVNEIGANGWYLGFAIRDNWQLVDTVNVSRDECARVLADHAALVAAQSDPPKSPVVLEFKSQCFGGDFAIAAVLSPNRTARKA